MYYLNRLQSEKQSDIMKGQERRRHMKEIKNWREQKKNVKSGEWRMANDERTISTMKFVCKNMIEILILRSLLLISRLNFLLFKWIRSVRMRMRTTTRAGMRVCVLYACKSPLYTYILHMQLFVLSYCLRASFFR